MAAWLIAAILALFVTTYGYELNTPPEKYGTTVNVEHEHGNKR